MISLDEISMAFSSAPSTKCGPKRPPIGIFSGCLVFKATKMLACPTHTIGLMMQQTQIHLKLARSDIFY